METNTTSIVISAISAGISLLTLIRTRQIPKLSEWAWRQKVGEELNAVSYLLVQNELACQREELQHKETERKIDLLGDNLKNHPITADIINSIATNRTAILEQDASFTVTRGILTDMWQSSSPRIDQFAKLQQLRSFLGESLAKREHFEMVQDRYLNDLNKYVADTQKTPKPINSTL